MKDWHRNHASGTLAGLLGWILLLWVVANFGPHLLIYVVFGQLYFGLPVYLAGPAEVGLLALNLVLPLWWLRQRGIPWREGLAWHWEGTTSWLWGFGGLSVVLIWGWVVTLLVPAAAVSAGGQGYPFPQLLLVLAGLVALWVAAVAGEEAMFRGWMQTQLETRGRVWLSIGLPALLFGLRHLPLDLYEGRAGMAGWTARLLELYGLALVLGLVRWRSRSSASTVVLHAALWWLVIFSVYGTAAGAAIGGILGVLVLLTKFLTSRRA